jgi:hypothetical protein
VAALVWSVNPALKNYEVVDILEQTATRPSGTGWSPAAGWGVLNAQAAVARALETTASPALPPPGSATPTTTTTSTTTITTPTPPPAAPALQCHVPNVKRLLLADARSRILSGNCSLGRVSRAKATIPKGRVISQSPAPGGGYANSTPVRLLVSRGH